METEKFRCWANVQSTVVVTVFLTMGQLLYANGEIRCYCNLPLCVSTGYMCKSAENACFSELSTHNNDPLHSRHGCIELLHRPKKEHCLARMRTAKNSLNKFPLLLCCEEDMCNYAKNLDVRIQINTKSNETVYVTGTEDAHFVGGHVHDAVARQDLWFRAAVIAVPIAGCFILVMLVLLAVRMLKKDSKRQRELIAFRHQRQLKARMLLGDHLNAEKNGYQQQQRHLLAMEEKNEANARLNQKQNNLYKNVNLVLCSQSPCNDKQYIYDKPFHNNDTLCGSLLTWSKLNWRPATPV